MKENQILTKGYKVTDSRARCRDYQFEVGKKYHQKGELELCVNGFHFCAKVADCFNYYSFDPQNRVFEVEAYGEVISNEDKSCTANIKFIRELTWHEMLSIANIGQGNSGLNNSGDRNSGNRNSGDLNSGNLNSGDLNSGDLNSGYLNSGDLNSGDRNSGNRNSGDLNSGNLNSGDRNSGNRNSGDLNSGNLNSGDLNSGDLNSGNLNSGDLNSGDLNSGYLNSGDLNSGDRNSGNRNSGDLNSGNLNSGDLNSGNRNSGYLNSGNRNSGLFCTGDAPFRIFNKKSSWSEQDFLNSNAYYLALNINKTIWVDESIMSEEEKKENFSYKTTGGFLKNIPFKEAFRNAWHNWSESNRSAFTSLPNFDAAVFEEITGVKI